MGADLAYLKKRGGEWKEIVPDRDGPHGVVGELTHFADCVRDNKTPIIDGRGWKTRRRGRFGNLSIRERGDQGRVADGGIEGLGWKGGRMERNILTSDLPTFQSSNL